MDFTQPQDTASRRWGVADLLAFGSFLLLTLIFLPAALVAIARLFTPDISTELSSEAQIRIQTVLDFVWVGFIFFLIKVVHGWGILESIRWVRTTRLRTGSLVALGATLAVGVMAISSLFPPAAPPPIQKLVDSSESVYLLLIFGVFLAPITEEIIFRGFFFNVLADLGGSQLAIPGTAFLFALMHIPQLWGSWAGIILILVVGYVLSLVRDRFNSLIPSFIVHTAYNAMLFGASALLTLAERK